jgi:hypothetical protein
MSPQPSKLLQGLCTGAGAGACRRSWTMVFGGFNHEKSTKIRISWGILGDVPWISMISRKLNEEKNVKHVDFMVICFFSILQ